MNHIAVALLNVIILCFKLFRWW